MQGGTEHYQSPEALERRDTAVAVAGGATASATVVAYDSRASDIWYGSGGLLIWFFWKLNCTL